MLAWCLVKSGILLPLFKGLKICSTLESLCHLKETGNYKLKLKLALQFPQNLTQIINFILEKCCQWSNSCAAHGSRNITRLKRLSDPDRLHWFHVFLLSNQERNVRRFNEIYFQSTNILSLQGSQDIHKDKVRGK